MYGITHDAIVRLAGHAFIPPAIVQDEHAATRIIFRALAFSGGGGDHRHASVARGLDEHVLQGAAVATHLLCI